MSIIGVRCRGPQRIVLQTTPLPGDAAGSLLLAHNGVSAVAAGPTDVFGKPLHIGLNCLMSRARTSLTPCSPLLYRAAVPWYGGIRHTLSNSAAEDVALPSAGLVALARPHDGSLLCSLEYDSVALRIDSEAGVIPWVAALTSASRVSSASTLQARVSNCALRPAAPAPGTALTLLLTLVGPDGRAASGHPILEHKCTVRWFCNGSELRILRDTLSVPGSFVRSGDAWYAVVTPRYKGRYEGQDVASNTVVVGSDEPRVLWARILPEQPTATDDLVLEYALANRTADDIEQVEVRWYSNGRLIESLNDQPTVGYSILSRGQQWRASVRVYDGQQWSDVCMTDAVTIANALPNAAQVTITPAEPQSDNDLAVSYVYADPDGDPETPPQPGVAEEDYPPGATRIWWYRNGAEVSALRNETLVPGTLVRSGDRWRCAVAPGDGIERGAVAWSDEVTVQ